MKISTTIRPRRDGTVTFQCGKVAYTFREDDRGDLVCDVGDDDAVTKMLLTDSFAPADPADYGRARELLGSGGGVGGEDDDDELDDDPVDPNAAPIEAMTPPAAPSAAAPAAAPAAEATPAAAPAAEASAAPIEAMTPPARFKPSKRAA